jgi:hypothetical protein
MPALPSRPNLEHLRHEARRLLRAAKAGDPDAIERIRTFSDRITLSTAQLTIAREHGWVSWSAMRHHIEERRRILEVANSPTGLDELDHRAHQLLHAVQSGDADAIKHMRSLSSSVELSTARDIIAREYGWRSWRALSNYVESLRRIRKAIEFSTEPESSLKLPYDQISAETPQILDPPPYEAAARAGLARWARFPVGADPRPLVLTGSTVRPGHFVDSACKRAFVAGAIEGAPGVAEEPVRLLRRAGRPDRITATTALLVTRADQSEAEFRTDRGRRLLSAWRIESRGSRDAIWAMDEATLARCWFPPPAVPHPTRPGSLRRVVLTHDGLTLQLRFSGGSASMVAYDGFVLETPTAVCIIPVARQLTMHPFRTALQTSEHTRKLVVRLARRLGTRVLVALDGGPIEVLSKGVT